MNEKYIDKAEMERILKEMSGYHDRRNIMNSKSNIAKGMIDKLLDDPELMQEFNTQMRIHKINNIKNSGKK